MSAPHPLEAKTPVVVEVAGVGDDEEDQAAEERADDLGDPVVAGLDEGDLAGQEERQRDRRVDVAPRDVADRVRHRQQGEAEGEGDAERAHRVGGEDRRARPDDHQHARADRLGGEDLEVRRAGGGDRLGRRGDGRRRRRVVGGRRLRLDVRAGLRRRARRWRRGRDVRHGGSLRCGTGGDLRVQGWHMRTSDGASPISRGRW